MCNFSSSGWNKIITRCFARSATTRISESWDRHSKAMLDRLAALLSVSLRHNVDSENFISETYEYKDIYKFNQHPSLIINPSPTLLSSQRRTEFTANRSITLYPTVTAFSMKLFTTLISSQLLLASISLALPAANSEGAISLRTSRPFPC